MEKQMIVYEFDNHHDFYEACKRSRELNIKVKAYSPLPEDDIIEVLGTNSGLVAPMALGGAILGCIGGFSLQFWQSAIDYPQNIGGRPLNSWASFLLITFELTVLLCGLGILAGFILSNNYPRFDRRIFSLQEFNARRHENFFLTSFEEVSNVKAFQRYNIAHSS